MPQVLAMPFAEIAVDAPLEPDRTFTYSVPSHLGLRPGHSIWVPFGPRRLQGIVFELTDSSNFEETREIIGLVDPALILGPRQLSLARWISRRYLCSLFEAAALMLPHGFRRKVRTFYSLNPGSWPDSFVPSESEKKALDALAEVGKTQIAGLKGKLGPRAQVRVEKLARSGVVTRESEWPRPVVSPKYETQFFLKVGAEEAVVQARLKKNAVNQRALLDALFEMPEGVSASELRERSISPGAIKILKERGVVGTRKVRVIRDPLASRHYERMDAPSLTEDQQRAWAPIKEALEKSAVGGEGNAFLLRGVTGSGKTELYLRALERTLELGRRGIVLVPEISLTPQTIQRFSSRFPGQVAVLHSRLKAGEKFDEWWRIRDGEFGVVIGPRSALFSPQPDLGLIVLDEEHDSSYKQSEPAPRYHARDAALELAKLSGAVVILGSATPDVTTSYKASIGELEYLELPRRISAGPKVSGVGEEGAGGMARVDVVDMKQELRSGNRDMFSRLLRSEMGKALDAGEQVILFINRRGFATSVHCRECGLVVRCRRCEVALIYHGAKGKLVCHHCGYNIRKPEMCRSCGSPDLGYLGTGTQRLEEEMRLRFPKARTFRWDRDSISKPSEHEEVLEKLQTGQIDILIGTQMVAQGLHLPQVTLVGVMSADVGINFPDFRAGERVFQLLTQVAGRAGRGPGGGRVVVQTFNPDHYAIQAVAAHDYVGFYRQETSYRRQNRYPPYARLTRLVHSQFDPAKAEAESQKVAVRLRKERDRLGLPQTDVLGPVPCFVPRLKGRYRWHVLIRSDEPARLLERVGLGEGWSVDVDPVTLL